MSLTSLKEDLVTPGEGQDRTLGELVPGVGVMRPTANVVASGAALPLAHLAILADHAAARERN
jgi:hypothetical protein